MKKIFPFVAFLMLAFLLAVPAVRSQSVSFNYHYRFDPVNFEGESLNEPVFEPPRLGTLEVAYPEAARKNGVQGTVKASATLDRDGKVRDVVVGQDVPFGVGNAVAAALQNFSFKPASINGRPVPIRMHLEYVITLLYAADDKNVTRPKITEKPAPQYPAKYLTEKLKGSVTVQVLFSADGTAKVFGVQSVMPKEFDTAAAEAAAKIKFQPASHKKSKQPVTQRMAVDYEFKP